MCIGIPYLPTLHYPDYNIAHPNQTDPNWAKQDWNSICVNKVQKDNSLLTSDINKIVVISSLFTHIFYIKMISKINFDFNFDFKIDAFCPVFLLSSSLSFLSVYHGIFALNFGEYSIFLAKDGKKQGKCKLHDRELIKRKLQKSIFLPL